MESKNHQSLLNITLATAAVSVFLKLGGVRIGPGRALFLGFKSFFSHCKPESVRKDLVKKIRSSLEKQIRGRFLIVTGPKGIGKTVGVTTAMKRKFGVVNVRIYRNESLDKIVDESLGNSSFYGDEAASRIIWWHRLFFRCSPTVVLTSNEKVTDKSFAHIPNAARTLSESYNLRVVVDGTDTSLPDGIFETLRENAIFVEAMSKENVENLNELNSLVAKLRISKLDNQVFCILGGVPANYESLMQVCDVLKDTEFLDAVELFLVREQAKAIELRDLAILNNPVLIELYRLFHEYDKIKYRLYFDFRVKHSSHVDEVLRRVYVDRSYYLTPTTPAMAYVLKHNCNEPHSIKEIQCS
jgi:hypothetical protein